MNLRVVHVESDSSFHLCHNTSWSVINLYPNATNWDTAATQHLRWNGGATNLDAATGRQSLELGTAATTAVGTAGGNILRLDGSARIPAVNAAALTALDGGKITTGTITPAHLAVGGCTDTEYLALTGGVWTCTSGALTSSLPKGYLTGLKLSWSSTSTIAITKGFARADDDSDDMALVSSVTVDISSSGINGIDSGSSLSPSTWYSVWVVKGASGVGGLLTSRTASPTLPAGYDVTKRRVGWIKTDGSSNIIIFTVRIDSSFGRYFTQGITSTNTYALSTFGGAIVNVAASVPPYIQFAEIQARKTGGAAYSYISHAQGAAAVFSASDARAGSANDSDNSNAVVSTTGAAIPSIYASSSANNTTQALIVTGWFDPL
jgi:hypothetical protein